MVRYYIICEGRVQGVGFRYFCQMNAVELDLTGYAHNLNNGMVEIEVQGQLENINKFVQKIKKVNFFIRIDDLSEKRIEVKNSEKKFYIRWQKRSA